MSSTNHDARDHGPEERRDRPPVRGPLVLLVSLLVVALFVDIVLLGEWRQRRGHEPVWIAKGLVSGEGYSFEDGHRWLFLTSDEPARRYPTAWIEPVYPLLLAACFAIFGDHGKLVILALQTLAVYATCIVVFRLAAPRFGAWTGAVAAGLLLLLPGTHAVAVQEIAAAPLAGLLLSLVVLLLFRVMERPTLRRTLALGMGTGVATLTLAPSLLTAPVSSLLLLTRRRADGRRPWTLVLAFWLVLCAVLAPWTVRNLVVFGEFVPVRNGSGVMLHMGNPALAKLFTPSPPGEPPPLFQSAGDAVAGTSQQVVDFLYLYQLKLMAEEGPPGYEGFNEAQRDQVLRRRALRFMFAHPGLTVELAFYRAVGYFLTFWKPAGALFALALLGAVVSFRDHRTVALLLLVLAIASPYLLTVPLFYRYRYPVEPLLALLGARPITGLWLCVSTRCSQAVPG